MIDSVNKNIKYAFVDMSLCVTIVIRQFSELIFGILPPPIFDHNQYSIGPGNVLVVTLFDIDIVFARIICLQ